MENHFDPFNDRIARDIRNALSKAFIPALATFDMEAVRKVAASFQTGKIEEIHRQYITARCDRYEKVVKTLKAAGEHDPVGQALVLWDQGLFFEVHERIEAVWMPAVGKERAALQGLIRAAGVYIHLEAGNKAAAQTMAVKAFSALEAYGHYLPALRRALSRLLDALENLESAAPRLLVDG